VTFEPVLHFPVVLRFHRFAFPWLLRNLCAGIGVMRVCRVSHDSKLVAAEFAESAGNDDRRGTDNSHPTTLYAGSSTHATLLQFVGGFSNLKASVFNRVGLFSPLYFVNGPQACQYILPSQNHWCLSCTAMRYERRWTRSPRCFLRKSTTLKSEKVFAETNTCTARSRRDTAVYYLFL
jgi:hypothetical protein